MEQDIPSVLELMLVHHGLLEVLFKSLSDNLKTAGARREFLKKMFEEFQWELEKHFFVEEKVIFKFGVNGQSNTYSIIVQLLEEHNRMLKMLEEARERLINKQPVKLTKFGQLLTEHRVIEEHKLYPNLDKKLDDSDKKSIEKRINQLPLVKTF